MQREWRPRKSLGQNFLVDQNISRKIVELAAIGPEETVMEIGPGKGALTGLLCEKAKRVVAVELDSELAAALPGIVGARNLSVVQQDVLTANFAELAKKHAVKRWPIVANLPYVIGSRLLMRLMEHAPVIERATVMVQYEVAERLLAGPGSRTYGLLSVLLQATGTLEKGFRVSAECFRPKPKVQSMVFTWHSNPPEGVDLVMLAETVKAAFNQRRKHLANALTRMHDINDVQAHIGCIDAGIDPTVRAEDLGPEEFIRLSETLAKMKAENRERERS